VTDDNIPLGTEHTKKEIEHICLLNKLSADLLGVRRGVLNKEKSQPFSLVRASAVKK